MSEPTFVFNTPLTYRHPIPTVDVETKEEGIVRPGIVVAVQVWREWAPITILQVRTRRDGKVSITGIPFGSRVRLLATDNTEIYNTVVRDYVTPVIK